MNIKIRRFIGIIGRLIYPTFGTCFHCGRPWPTCKNHVTLFDEGKGCFPLCEECWAELTIEERIPFYRQLVNEWISCCKPGEHLEIITLELDKLAIIDAVKKGG